jgi:unsaturated rhamnogalacturonyl hydrolase
VLETVSIIAHPVSQRQWQVAAANSNPGGKASRGGRVFSDLVRQRVLESLLVMQRHSWDQGVASAVLADAGRDDLLRVLLDDAVARQLPDGRLAELEAPALANSGAIGEVLRDQAIRSGDAAWLAASERQHRWLADGAPRAADGTLFHIADRREVWADSVYMVVPALAAYGDHDDALAQLAGHRTRLRDPESGLWRSRWEEDRQRLWDERAWGTANGWVVAALARTVPRLLPDIGRSLIGELRTLVDDCLRWRRADGLFGNLLDDPQSFRETNVAAMLAYGALTGAGAGWLPAQYGKVGASLLESVAEQVDEFGRVTGACAAPHFDRPGFSPEAQAFALLADSAHRRLGGTRN